MYAYIRGELIQSTPMSVVIETGGIGYCIYIPLSVFSKLPQLGSVLLLHTSYIVRELSQSLYGFLTAQECHVFEMLMDVSGVGPKLALSIVGHLQLHDLKNAILNHDIMKICKVPGVGKKTAERLIIELRDKIITTLPPDPSDHSIQISHDPKMQQLRDAMSALINLGYNQVTAQKAIKKAMQDAPEELNLALLITNSLKNV